MATEAKMEVVLKFSEFPEAETVENGWQYFELDSEGIIISITGLCCMKVAIATTPLSGVN